MSGNCAEQWVPKRKIKKYSSKRSQESRVISCCSVVLPWSAPLRCLSFCTYCYSYSLDARFLTCFSSEVCVVKVQRHCKHKEVLETPKLPLFRSKSTDTLLLCWFISHLFRDIIFITCHFFLTVLNWSMVFLSGKCKFRISLCVFIYLFTRHFHQIFSPI